VNYEVICHREQREDIVAQQQQELDREDPTFFHQHYSPVWVKYQLWKKMYLQLLWALTFSEKIKENFVAMRLFRFCGDKVGVLVFFFIPSLGW
jgi:hypothetical protein